MNDVSMTSELSLRDYFAAHAPQKIPEWFIPKMPDRPTAPRRPSMGKDELNDRIASWLRDDGGVDLVAFFEDVDLPAPEIQVLWNYQEDRREWFEAVEQWEQLRFIERVAQWPWFWADRVLGRRDK